MRPAVELPPHSSAKISTSDNEESEEDPEEEVEEDSEEDLVLDPEEDMEEGKEEQLEDDLEVEPEEDREEQLEEDSEVEPEEDPEEVLEEDLSEDPDEDPSGEYVSQPSSESDTNKIDHNSSNGKKRPVDATVSKFAPWQVHQSQKNRRYEDASKPEFAYGSAVKASASEKEEHLGNSSKRRRSRWEPQLEPDGESGVRERNTERRKTRWDIDDSQLQMPGPLQLLDLGKYFDQSEFLQLKVRLIEINNKLITSELHDERPEAERSPSPEPVYNNLGIRVNTSEVRLRAKLTRERRRILSKLIKKNPAFKVPPVNKPEKFFKKLYIPVKEYPSYNFIGHILGPRGNTQKRMEKETGAKILLRGKGSGKTSQTADPSDDEDLHVLIEASNKNSLDAAVMMVEKLLIPQDDQINSLKLSQLAELAKLKGTYRNDIICLVCNEDGHKSYACPQRPSTFKATITCDTCGSFSHPTSSCPSTASSKVSKKIQPKKEIDDTNIYVGYLPQAVDDSRLREMFSPFGKITSSVVIKDRNTGLSKCYGFVQFGNSMDAATAVMHMHGYKMAGHMLAVRVAGTPPAPQVTGFPALTPLPVYPGPAVVYPAPAAVYPGITNQAAWPGQPASMLSRAQVSFPNSVGVGLTPPLAYLGHGNQLPSIRLTNFTPLPVMSNLTRSNAAFSAPDLLTQFPGDPDYPGSELRSYFATSTL